MARSFGNQVAHTTDKVVYPTSTGILYNQTAASVVCWFKRPTAPTSGEFPRLFLNYGAFNREVYIQMIASSGATQGKLMCQWRATGISEISASTTRWDDDAWHWLLYVRRSTSPYTELYIDGVSDGSNTTDPGTSSTALIAAECMIGNSSEEGILSSSGWGGSIARVGVFTGITLTVDQAKAFLFGGQYPQTPALWLEMLGAGTADYSPNQRSATVTGTALADHPWAARFANRHGILTLPADTVATTRLRNLLLLGVGV